MNTKLLFSIVFTLSISLWITPFHAQKVKSSKTSLRKTKTTTPKSSKRKTRRTVKYNAPSTGATYYNGHQIHIGPRGGRYYINRNGNKTYIPRR